VRNKMERSLMAIFSPGKDDVTSKLGTLKSGQNYRSQEKLDMMNVATCVSPNLLN